MAKTNLEYTQADLLARYLPDGYAWRAKWIDESFLRRLLKGFGKEFGNIEQRNAWLKRELNIFTTTDLIENWEKEYGIPDEVFTIDGKTIEQRRLNIIIKEIMDGADRSPDWEYIAEQFGFKVKVYAGTDKTKFTYTFPIIFADYPKYTIIVDMYDVLPPAEFTLIFSVVFGEDRANLLKKVFEIIKPADCVIIYNYILNN